MSQPRRRRRRGRRRGGGGGSSDQNKRENANQAQQAGDGQPQQRSSRSRRSRGRRGRTRARDARTSSPKSSEDLVRGDPKRPPVRLTREHDGTTLEQVIGELQSEHGVPQHPQEYRITLKVAEERAERASPDDAPVTDASDAAVDPDRPKREKAPAAPRMGTSDGDGESEGSTPPKTSRRRRSRRRRRKKSSGGS